MFRKRISILVAWATLGAAAALVLGPAASSAPGDNAVVHWSEVAEAAISAGPAPGTLRPPATSAVLAGMVHGAMYDAVAAIDTVLEPFATGLTAPPGASADAAVATAARDVLVARVPAQAGAVNTAYGAFMAGIPAGAAKEAGTAVGAAAAAGMLAFRQGDGFGAPIAYVQPTPGPGVFEPIAPTSPVSVELSYVRPFTYESHAYRPGPPYALTSKKYAEDVAELKLLGGVNSTARTQAQTDTARFHGAPTYVQFSRGLQKLVRDHGFGLRESARLLGYTWVAVGDTMIACWEAKYHYMFWRPNHAIQRADTDGNATTSPDTTWLPLIVGNHPEYPSGHACFTGGVTASLQSYFRTKHVELTLTTPAGVSRTYDRLDDLVAEVNDGRVWGGLHYRSTMEETAKHFPRIAQDVGKEHFLKPRK
jgi:hypothetical protein